MGLCLLPRVRMTATECLSHRWLQRRKSVETSCSAPISQTNNELDYQKDTLRNLVDRWNDETNIIPATANENDKSKIIEISNANGMIEEKSKLPETNPKLVDRRIEPESSPVPQKQPKLENTLPETVEKTVKASPVTSALKTEASSFVVSDSSCKPAVLNNSKQENTSEKSNEVAPKSDDVGKTRSVQPVKTSKLEQSDSAPSNDNHSQLRENPSKQSVLSDSETSLQNKMEKSNIKSKPDNVEESQGVQVKPYELKQTDIASNENICKLRENKEKEVITSKPKKAEVRDTVSKPEGLLNGVSSISVKISSDKSANPAHSVIEKHVVSSPTNDTKQSLKVNADLTLTRSKSSTEVRPKTDISSNISQDKPKKAISNEILDKDTLSRVETVELKPKRNTAVCSKESAETKPITNTLYSKAPAETKPVNNARSKESAEKKPTEIVFGVKDSTETKPVNNALHLKDSAEKKSINNVPCSKESAEKKPNNASSSKESTETKPVNNAHYVKESAEKKPINNTPCSKESAEKPVDNALYSKESAEKKPETTETKPINNALHLEKSAKTKAYIVQENQLTEIKNDKTRKASEYICPVIIHPVKVNELESDTSSTQSETNSEAKHESHAGLKVVKKVKSKSVSPKVTRKVKSGVSSESNVQVASKAIEDDNLVILRLNESNDAKRSTGSTTTSETVTFSKNAGQPSTNEINAEFRILSANSPKEGVHRLVMSCSSTASDSSKKKGVGRRDTCTKVEVNDESYECVKKRSFVIKNIVENYEHKTELESPAHSSTHADRKGDSSEENMLDSHHDSILQRRISDITSLLSRADIDRSIEEMTSFCKNLNQMVRIRADNNSRTSSSENSSKRPKFRISCFSRDVPFSNSPPYHAQLLNYLPLGADDDSIATSPTWSFHKADSFHSDPGSLRDSPERFGPPSLTRKILSKFFSDSMEYNLASVPSTSHTITKDKITELIS